MSDRDFVYVTADIPGVFAFDRDKNVMGYSLFPSDPDEVLEKLKSLRQGGRVEELEDVLEQIGTHNIVTDLSFEAEGFNVEVNEDISAYEHLKNKRREYAISYGFVEDEEELNRIINDIAISRARESIKTSVEKDKIVGQAISAIEDLNEVSNELSERLREWYGLYYPELEINSNETYAKLVSEKGERENFEDFDGSMGTDMDRRDVDAVKSFAEEIKEIFDLKDSLLGYLEDVVPSIAPNMTHIVGPKITAKLISLAGSVEKLAKMPSSKIQLLGAEKALFRHLKGGGKPPKYGVIFNHHIWAVYHRLSDA
ncbi:MAG: NOP5/NOP56 family protein, partial [Candidatus Aenigmatarchaeota archaeon]